MADRQHDDSLHAHLADRPGDVPGVEDLSLLEPLNRGSPSTHGRRPAREQPRRSCGCSSSTRHVRRVLGRRRCRRHSDSRTAAGSDRLDLDGTDGDPRRALRSGSGAGTPFTRSFNVTGQPAISVPLHWSDDGLPIGVQFDRPPFDEATLIRLAAQLEQARPWADKRPPGV